MACISFRLVLGGSAFSLLPTRAAELGLLFIRRSIDEPTVLRAARSDDRAVVDIGQPAARLRRMVDDVSQTPGMSLQPGPSGAKRMRRLLLEPSGPCGSSRKSVSALKLAGTRPASARGSAEALRIRRLVSPHYDDLAATVAARRPWRGYGQRDGLQTGLGRVAPALGQQAVDKSR